MQDEYNAQIEKEKEQAEKERRMVEAEQQLQELKNDLSKWQSDAVTSALKSTEVGKALLKDLQG